MEATHSVGIDLGTTYSCIAYLNEQGEPVTLPNQEGELATPSAVLFRDDDVIVGTQALRNAIRYPDKVVVNSKRFIGDSKKKWTINGKPYTPVHIATFILKKLISAAQEQIGSIEKAVVTVPAQFSDAQRHATVEAGHRAGLKQVDIINEPVAAALCYVLGSEGLWFTELADQQRIMVYDLGGGTFDLSLVMYQKDEVSVIASSGDLQLGGIDWNQALIRNVANQFQKEFGENPWNSLEAMQYLANEAEQTKRSLSVRPKAAMACRVDDKRKAYQITVEQFEKMTEDLVEHTADITKRMLKDNKMGWAHVDVVLTTGGASRMPMIRRRLKELSGTTLNTSLSPDLSIAHGATYYAGMLLTNDQFAKSILSKEAKRRLASVRQRSVNARGLGILVRNPKTDRREPHYLLPANTPLPADVTNVYGTVVPNQKRVHLQIVESGIRDGAEPVKLGNCVINNLPPNLPEGSEIAVTISYDSEARVHVSAKDVASGKRAHTEIVRQENVVPQLAADHGDKADLKLIQQGEQQQPIELEKSSSPRPASTQPKKQEEQPAREPSRTAAPSPQPAAKQKRARQPRPASPQREHAEPQKPVKEKAERDKPKIKPRAIPQASGVIRKRSLEESDQPVPLCNECGEPLDSRGQCAACAAAAAKAPQKKKQPKAKPSGRPRPAPPPLDDAEILELDQAGPPPKRRKPARPQPAPQRAARPKTRPQPKPRPKESGEDEFWQLVDD